MASYKPNQARYNPTLHEAANLVRDSSEPRLRRSSVPPNWACHLNHLSTFGLSDFSWHCPFRRPSSSRGLAQRHLVDAFSLPLLCPKFCHQLVEEVKHFRDWREAAKEISPGSRWAIWEKVCWKRWWDVLDDSFYMLLWHSFFWIHHDTPKSKVTMESDIALQIVDDYNDYRCGFPWITTGYFVVAALSSSSKLPCRAPPKLQMVSVPDQSWLQNVIQPAASRCLAQRKEYL